MGTDNAQPMPGQQQEQVGLTVNDLHVMVSIIETCSERGAFEAKEMSSVGMIYNKLVAFLANQAAMAQAAIAQQAAPKTDAPKVEESKAADDSSK